VHAASVDTIYCYLADTTDDKWSGHLDLYAGFMTPDSSIESITPIIRRGYYTYEGRPYPRQIGYAVFYVPEFDHGGNVPDCTLYYYQSAHSGSPSLEVRDMGIEISNPSRSEMYYGAWCSDVVMAEDDTHQNGWHTVALTGEGAGVIVAFSANGYLYTGWVYPDDTSGIYTEVDGATCDSLPYIKVVTK